MTAKHITTEIEYVNHDKHFIIRKTEGCIDEFRYEVEGQGQFVFNPEDINFIVDCLKDYNPDE